jgi:hypothetical protein
MIPGRPAGALWLAGFAAAAPAQSPQAPAASSPAAEALVEQVVARVGPAPQDGTEQGLFQRLARQQRSASPATAEPSRGRAAALVPAMAWAMEQLDPVSFAVIRPVPVGGSGALLRTGDVFVLQFSTSLPGQVRLENVDPKGQVADLGTYTVLVDQLNRLPRDRGIQLQGQPGVERLRFYFYPCLPAEAAAKPWATEFKGKLPACGPAPAQQVAGSPHLGTVSPRAMVNLAQPDAHVALAGSTDYQPGDVTLMEAHIRHESRGHAR